MAKNIKKRNWAFVLYPESAPSNWREILQKTGLQCVISPLHDKDINPTGEPKKAHYHIILCYSGPTSYNVVKSITDSLNQPIPQPLEQIKGYYRYLTHKDNPEKAQYSDEDIETLNGFKISDYIELNKSEVMVIKIELIEFIQKYDLCEYSHFMDLVKDNLSDIYFEIASNHTLFFNSYLKSRRYSKEKSEKNT